MLTRYRRSRAGPRAVSLYSHVIKALAGYQPMGAGGVWGSIRKNVRGSRGKKGERLTEWPGWVREGEAAARLPSSLLHWLPIIARIRFKTLVLAYKAVSGTAPTYLQTLVRPHAPARALCSTTSARRLVPPSLRTGKHLCQVPTLLCSALAPQNRTEQSPLDSA